MTFPRLCVCGHLWDWHGPGKDCIGCGCMFYRPGDEEGA